MKNPYILTGAILLIIGLYFTGFAYFALESTPLTAVGLSTVVVGFTSMGLASTRTNSSPEATRIILKTCANNTALILETLGIQNRAIYLPQTGYSENARALVPLNRIIDVPNIREISPHDLLTRPASGTDGMAIAMTTPGNLCLSLLKSKPGASENEIRSATSYILSGVLDIASEVKVAFSGSRIQIKVNGVTPEHEDNLFYHCFGSPIASIAAAICSQALEKPVRIIEEINHKKVNQITLEVLS
jgi:hypothetical protein